MRGLSRYCWILAIGILCAGCKPLTQNSIPTSTPWPTLAAVLTPFPNQTRDQSTGGPELRDKFRVDVANGTTAIYQLEGHADQPVRIEVLVLDGNLDPTIHINNAEGHSLAIANSGGPGEPEVIGQFQFPSDAFYELGIGTTEGSGQLGVSIYNLEPASIEGGGIFTSMDQELSGRLAQPASYHIFQLPVERGQRFDIAATGETEGLDLIFYLYAPDGTLVETRDDNIDKNPVLWDYMPKQAGTYFLVLTNFDEQTGYYTVDFRSSEPAVEAEIGVRSEITLTATPRRMSWVTFSGLAFDALRIEARPIGEKVDIAFALYDQYGNSLIRANEHGVDETEMLGFVQLPFDGTYQVAFTTLGEGGTIEYVIRTSRDLQEKLGGRIAPSNFGRKGSIEEVGTMLSYSFDLQAGDLLSVAARAVIPGGGLDLAFSVYGPDGTLISLHDDDVGKDPIADRIEVSLPGRYVVTLWNFGGTLGDFELVIDSPEAPAAPPSN